MGDEAFQEGFGGEGGLTLEQEVEGTAQAVDVSAVVGGLGVVGLFGCQEVDGTHVGTGLGQGMVGVSAELGGGLDDAGDAEVENAELAGSVDHEIAGLDVAVDDALGVGGFEAAGGLDRAMEGEAELEGAAVGDQAVEVVAVDVVHCQEVDAAIFAGFDGGDDIGVGEAAGDGEFAMEAADGIVILGEGGGRILRATRRRDGWWRALKTTPMPPTAILSSTR